MPVAAAVAYGVNLVAAIPLSAANWVVRAFDVWVGVFVVHQGRRGLQLRGFAVIA